MEPKAPIVINKVPFIPLYPQGSPEYLSLYKYDYIKAVEYINSGQYTQEQVYRQMTLNDLWFIVYFVMGIPGANHPFVIKMCKEIENGPATKTLDVWSRGHFKSSVITIAETAQYHLKNPDHCTCLFSFKKPAAEKFLDGVRRVWEKEIMIACFPDVLFDNPEGQSPSWSLQNGITIKRQNTARREKTVEASGLVEGMATGSHFERRIYDDVETADMGDSPDVMDTCYSRFEMSAYLGTGRESDIERVIGTFYNHAGPLVQIRDKQNTDGSLAYHTRIVPATVDGTVDGQPVLLTPKKLEEEKVKAHFYSQMLCDPTPRGAQKLDSNLMREIQPEFIPKNLLKFMVVDPAGDNKGGRGDSWAILVIGIDPSTDEIGANNIYITNAVISPMSDAEAIEEIVRLYLLSGVILKVGVEKVGLSSAEVHITNALKAKGRRISVDDESLILLRPGGRDKVDRIEKALSWPLRNGKIHLSMSVAPTYRQRLKNEMDKFPHWKKDGIDALSYIYDIIKDYRFAPKARQWSRQDFSVASAGGY